MAPPAAGPTILVVEDDDAVRTFFLTALRTAGYRAVGLVDGVDALHWIDQHTPALIVLDLNLVRLSGRDLQRELRAHAHTRNIPVVIVTGGDTSDLNSAELACILHKPVTVSALVDAVTECIQRR